MIVPLDAVDNGRFAAQYCLGDCFPSIYMQVLEGVGVWHEYMCVSGELRYLAGRMTCVYMYIDLIM